MPPPKKAAKKAAKKSAIHPHEKHHLGHKEAKDLRRAFEHLGRVEALQGGLPPAFGEAVHVLIALAQQQISNGRNKDSADLLRGAEHLSFAALAPDGAKGTRLSKLSKELVGSITEQYEELNRRADEHWNLEELRPAALNAIYQNARKGAAKAFKAGSYHKALEFARTAEALAHVECDGLHQLSSGSEYDIELLKLAV